MCGLLLVCVTLLSTRDAVADVVVTNDGRRIEGKVLRRDAEGVLLGLPSGEILIPAERVKEVIPKKTVWEEYAERAEKAKSAREHVVLAEWALERGLRKEAAAEAKKALEAEPENERALSLLDRLEGRRVKARRDEAAEVRLAKEEAVPDGFEVFRGGEFMLATDVGEKRAGHYLSVLNELYRALRVKYSSVWRGRGREPMLALLFSRREDYRDFVKKDGVDAAVDSYGYYSGKKHKAYVFEFPGRTEAFLMHECTHQVYVERMKPKRTFTSMWLFEGMAERSEGWWNPRRKRVEVGRLHRGDMFALKAALKRDELIPLEKFLAAEKFADLFDEGYDTSACRVAYAQAWGWFLFLMKRHRSAFVRYWKREQDGRSGVEEFAKTVGKLDRLMSEWQNFIRGLK